MPHAPAIVAGDLLERRTQRIVHRLGFIGRSRDVLQDLKGFGAVGNLLFENLIDIPHLPFGLFAFANIHHHADSKPWLSLPVLLRSDHFASILQPANFTLWQDHSELRSITIKYVCLSSGWINSITRCRSTISSDGIRANMRSSSDHTTSSVLTSNE